jgi:hypothetical protein
MTDTTAAPARRIAYMIGAGRVNFVLNGRSRSYIVESEQGRQLIELLKQTPQPIDQIGEIAEIVTWVVKLSKGRVSVDDNQQIRLDGRSIDYGLSGRALQIIQQGMSFDSLANFIELLSENPDKSVAEDLYRFMERGALPLDEDGHILAFKKVKDDYMSYFSGAHKVRYMPGDTPSMPREECDPNRHKTCSRGLHACSMEYLNFWYSQSGKVMIVRINPRDVTAIPADHQDQKLRCCLMEVVGEIPEEDAKTHFPKVVDNRYRPAPKPEPTEEQIVEAVEAATGPLEEPRRRIISADQPDDSEPELTPFVRGRADGETSGRQDAVNEYTYDPAIAFPDDLATVDRPEYARGFVEGYESGWRSENLEPVEAAEPDE